MRMAFGLVSLLVVLGIVMLLFSIYEAPVLKRGKSAQDDARAIAGRDENNAPVTDAVTLDAQDRNGRMEGAVVTSITPGSALEQRFGLQNGDVILSMGPLSVRDNMSSAGEAKDFLLDAYQKNQQLVVMRGFERVTLPMDPAAARAAAAAAPAPTAPTAAAPGATQPPANDAAQASAQQPDAAPQKKPKKNTGLEGQLDLIRNIPGQ
jgi:hypothetical protein